MISGKRELLLECDSCRIAEVSFTISCCIESEHLTIIPFILFASLFFQEWTEAIYDVIINEDLAFLRNLYPAAPAVSTCFDSVRDLQQFKEACGAVLTNGCVLSMCDMILLQYQSAQQTLRQGVHCIVYGVSQLGDTIVHAGHVTVILIFIAI